MKKILPLRQLSIKYYLNEVKNIVAVVLKNSVNLFLVSDLHTFKYHQSKWLSGVGLFVW